MAYKFNKFGVYFWGIQCTQSLKCIYILINYEKVEEEEKEQNHFTLFVFGIITTRAIIREHAERHKNIF